MDHTPTTPRSSVGNMRASRQRPTSLQGVTPHTAIPAAAIRKIFNCIVDDSALVAGVKRSTRNGIRQWVKNTQIRLFVPLHALEQLSRQKNGNNRHAEDVRETLQWLDDATTKYPHAVTLQGGDQYFEKWTDVERFAVPRTLFSMYDHVDDGELDADKDELPEATAAKLTLEDDSHMHMTSSVGSDGPRSVTMSSIQSVRSSISPLSPPTSPTRAVSSPAKPATTVMSTSAQATSASGSVPIKLQSLFNYILWRVHQELDPAAALESFIFLCNDPSKVECARSFDIRSKRLEQLRDAVGREDRDFRNRQMVQNRENQSAVKSSPQDGDDEVVYKPQFKAPAATVSKKQQQPSNVIDPDAFIRTTPLPLQSPQALQAQIFQNVPTGPASRGGNRGSKARGAARGRGNMMASRGSTTTAFSGFESRPEPGPIDPNSFTRPRGSGYTGRGGRRLWVPT